MTPLEIKAFQDTHNDWLGLPLVVDGTLGPKTSWALSVSQLEPARQSIVRRACSRVGELESRGANRSPFIDELMDRCGSERGGSWCAAFASWCVSAGGLPSIREASVLALGRLLRSTTMPMPGDVMWFHTGSSTGHCGIVIGLGPGEVACVEGNSGDSVRLTRRLSGLVRFGCPLPVPVLPGVPPGLLLAPVQYAGTR